MKCELSPPLNILDLFRFALSDLLPHTLSKTITMLSKIEDPKLIVFSLHSLPPTLPSIPLAPPFSGTLRVLEIPLFLGPSPSLTLATVPFLLSLSDLTGPVESWWDVVPAYRDIFVSNLLTLYPSHDVYLQIKDVTFIRAHSLLLVEMTSQDE